MAFSHVQWSSRTLGKAVGANILLPESGDGPFPVFYLLHGLSDDYTMWHRRSRIEWYVRDLPMIVVMPDGFRGFYTDHANGGPAYARYMAEDLPAFVERHYRARTDADAATHGPARAIGGLSMGGYGALRIALGYPGRYASANSHSGALTFGSDPGLAVHRDTPEFRLILGDKPGGTDHDLQALARRAVASGKAPAVRIDCGTEDFLIEENRTAHAAFTKIGLQHEYQEYPGAHTWDYWDTHVQTALQFHAKHLGLLTPAAPVTPPKAAAKTK